MATPDVVRGVWRQMFDNFVNSGETPTDAAVHVAGYVGERMRSEGGGVFLRKVKWRP